MIVYGETVADWVESKLSVKFVPPFSAIGATDSAGQIIAAFVFNMVTQYDVEVSLAAHRMPRSLMKAVYRYIVETQGCRRATFRTRADNTTAIEALERLGGRYEGRQRLYFGDCDGLLYGILKEDFPFRG